MNKHSSSVAGARPSGASWRPTQACRCRLPRTKSEMRLTQQRKPSHGCTIHLGFKWSRATILDWTSVRSWSPPGCRKVMMMRPGGFPQCTGALICSELFRRGASFFELCALCALVMCFGGHGVVMLMSACCHETSRCRLP